VIALMAMVIDRITAGLAARSGDYDPQDKSLAQKHRSWIVAVLGSALIFVLAQIFGVLNDWPGAWELNPARAMNDGLSYLVVNFRDQIETIKKLAFFFVMLPAKIGLQGAVSPFTWGFALTMTHKIAYALGMVAFAGWAAYRKSVKAGLAILIFAILIYFGLTGLPWPALLLIGTVAGWRIGGRWGLGSSSSPASGPRRCCLSTFAASRC
jgi:glycine betaine/proline transport system permease protein